ncbi:HDOD domain-containing protein [Chitinimonas sp.]|uniref:HDOD domain-containing protein n=1 Tax=Chitinimonas sp. TaxID=1934313 RepID=UPI002F926FBD
MDETVYTLIAEDGYTWLAHAEDGHLALLVPDPGIGSAIYPSNPNHPLLATLEGDAEIDGERWLAYRWAVGGSLAARLNSGPLPVDDALELILKLLDATLHARLLGMGLGRIDATRVLLGTGGTVSLAVVLPPEAHSERALQDMAGLLYHMLAGKRPVLDEQGVAQPLLSVQPDIPAALAAVVHGGLGDGTAPRQESLLAFRAALQHYQQTAGGVDEVPIEDDGLTGQLLRRIENTDDFPALSRAIGAISRITDGDTEKLQALATVILRDFSLTNKVLRLANSASYGQFGGAISTISRAVMVLGFGTVKALAMTLVLIEHLTNNEYAGELKDEVARAFFSSLLARQLAERSGYRDLEEARVAGMFHLLGRLLALFYFHDDTVTIARLIASGEEEEGAVRRTLGVSYEELGMGVARAWNLPGKLVTSMAAESGKPRPPRHDGDWLRLFANAGKAMMRAGLADNEQDRYKGFLQIRDRFGESLRFSERDFRVAMDDALRETLREATIFGLEAQSGGVLARLRQLAGLPAIAAAVDAPAAPTPSAGAEEVALAPVAAEVLPPQDRPLVVEALASCVQDVTETLVGDFRLNDLLRMILETLYRSLGVDRVLIATRSVQRNAIVGRFGFGDDVDSFLGRFALPLDDSADVFRVTLSQNLDVLIEDVDNAAIRDRIPAWFKSSGAGKTFLLMPVVIDRKIVGLFYADRAVAGSLQLGQRELALCKTLRNQAILAIRQKTPPATLG